MLGPKVVHVWDTKGFEHKFIVKGRGESNNKYKLKV